MRLSSLAAGSRLLAAASALGLLAACGGAQSPVPSLAAARLDPGSGSPFASSGPIQHIIIVVQENQSFDHLFNGYPNANWVKSGPIHTGQVVPLTELELGVATNTNHYAGDFLSAYDGGRMDGFDINGSGSPNLLAYTYTDPANLKPYWSMAQQYVLNDAFFTSHIDASFVAHQYLIAAQANHSVNLPSGAYGCSGGSAPDYVPTLNLNRTIGPFESPCFDYKTLGDELDSAGLTWRFYAPSVKTNASGSIWSAYQAVNHIYNGPDWKKDVISPQTKVLTDIGNGLLENVTWVIPSFDDSDHPGSGKKSGPSWVASVVNAVGNSKYWNSSAILILWDEWGGEYDHVKPPRKDYDGDGFRVPLLCISPYAYTGLVNHTQLEVGGVAKFVETTFNLPPLAAADKRATSVGTPCLNPAQKSPRTFVPIPADLGADYFIHEQADGRAPDDY